MKRTGSGVGLLTIAAGVMVLDQLTKFWVVRHFQLYESRVVIPGFFHLTYLTNTGAAFGFLAGEQNVLRQVFFIGVALVAILALGYFYRTMKNRTPLFTVAIGLISGGAVGNLIDRLRLGSVIDFLDFFIGRYHWPAFNVADSAITVGVGLFLLASLLDGKAEKRL